MPLVFAKEGEANFIRKVTGKEETRLFLEKLGFVAGAAVTVVSSIGGNLIVNVKDSRVAIDKNMAKGIFIG
ncbi:MAG: ferrous iron transport protein A [Bacillus sp. (in: Bacteria)]|nr:ferrous iron transport protein A [Bacillus sp. (in: firmicutes)]MCM1426627.1 ferrous iron transport protein A [Eubacterium sp.]